MRFFLDTASLEEIKEAAAWSIVDGVTTNPTLIRKAILDQRDSENGLDIEGYIKKILAQVGRMSPVSLEVAALDADTMVNQGMMLYEKFNAVAGNVVIKIPVCTVNTRGEGNPFDGITAIQGLADEKIPVNATLIFTPEQALLAAKAGAEYVSPFAGRVDDRIRRQAGVAFGKADYFPAGGMALDPDADEILTDHGLVSGVDLIERIVEIFGQYEIECEVIAASLRNPIQVREVAAAGADIATMPFDVLKSMLIHPGTAEGVEAFTRDLESEYLALFDEQADSVQ